MTTDVLLTLYQMGGYAEPLNVRVTPFSVTHDEAITFADDNEHTIVTIDAPHERIILRSTDGLTHEFGWENVNEATHALTNMETGHTEH